MAFATASMDRRVAIVGDSFVWGHDVESDERFTEWLQQQHPEWEVLNLGVSGYGTDQEYLLVQEFFDRYRPNVVIPVVSRNDRHDNRVHAQFDSYKPYFERPVGAADLALRGALVAASRLWLPARIMVPDPSHDLIRAMRDFVGQRGGAFGVACVLPDRAPRRFCRSQQIESVVLNGDRYPARGKHWTPAGHAQVALQLSELLETHATRFGLN